VIHKQNSGLKFVWCSIFSSHSVWSCR